MASKPFSKAAKLFKHRRFEQVIRLLEPQVFRFRESFNFYHLLGFSCLHVGDYGSAYTYLKRGHNLKPADIETMLGLAAVHLKRQETAQALEYWLEVLESEPKNIYAQRGMRLLKKNSDPEFLVDYSESGKIERLIPQASGPVLLPRIVILIVILLLTGAVLFFAPFSPLYRSDLTNAETIGALDLGDLTDLVEGEKIDHPFSFTEKEIEKKFEQISNYFHADRDNMVRREINRILLSNASFGVREKAKQVLPYLKTPTFSTFRDNFSYSEVILEPALHAGCFVNWKGAVSNLSINETNISFDLLVGYETNRVMEGIVPVSVPFSVRIDPERAIEVLGSVRLSGNNTYPVILDAVSIHQFIQE